MPANRSKYEYPFHVSPTGNQHDAIVLAERAEGYRIEYKELRSYEAISWNRPKEVHLSMADPTIPTF